MGCNALSNHYINMDTMLINKMFENGVHPQICVEKNDTCTPW